MLIVAQPKSASTSLMAALGALTGLPAVQRKSLESGARAGVSFAEAFGPRDEFAALPHSDMGERLPEDLLGGWLRDRATIFKQHVVPTEANLALLRATREPYVLLLRDPAESVASYDRIPPERAGAPVPGHAVARRLADEPGYREALGSAMRTFHARHRALAEELGPERALVLDYQDLMERPRRTVNRALEFWGFAARAGWFYSLPKKRYYRD